MEFDIQTILYIVFGLLYFVFTRGKKKRNTEAGRPANTSPEDQSETLGPPPVSRKPSFEELLEEFTTGKKAEPLIEVQDYEEIKPIVIPEQKMEVQAPVIKERKKIDEPLFKRFEEFEDEELITTDYGRILRAPDGAKKAFVFGEIFNRKY